MLKPEDRLTNQLARLWRHIGSRRRTQFILLVGLMLLASACEVVTISAVVPFLILLTNPSKLMEHDSAQPILHLLRVDTSERLLVYMTIAFAAASLIAAAMRTALLWSSTRYACMTGADLSIDIYRRTLYQPYLTHVARNTSEVISGITVKANHIIAGVIGPGLTLLSSGLMLIAILTTLLALDYVVALSAFSGFAVIYAVIFKSTRRKLVANSAQNSHESNLVFKALQEGLGGIRDVLIDGTQETYCQVYRSADLRMRHTQANMLFIGQWPRYMLEGLGMALIATIAFSLARDGGGLSSAIPFLGALALGAQRLLPIVQQAYTSWSSIYGSQSQLKATLQFLDQPLPEHVFQIDTQPLNIRDGIYLKNLGFRYGQTSPWVLRNLNLYIPKGSRLGIIGASGGGKSTLIDLLMGLLSPNEGDIRIDSTAISEANRRNWQCALAHVPQSIFLTDNTIAENIAFGIPASEIDMDKVAQAASKAQLSELIESWPAKYETMVGERGIRLSGGQRQRIGIARALYKRAQVIIFDEATSALDTQTEVAVMSSIEALGADLTLVIVAHRLSTLCMCDHIIEVGRGGVLREGSYETIVHSDINQAKS